MQTVKVVFAIGWAAFWAYWLAAAFSMKRGRVSWARELRIRSLIVVLAIVLTRLGAFRGHGLNRDPWRGGLGLVLFALGLGLAIWARVNIGRNWGTPMSQKNEPELVTSGPYHLIRHPIYSGVLLAGVATAVALSWLWLSPWLWPGSTSSTARPWKSAPWPSSFPSNTRRIGARRGCSCPSSSRWTDFATVSTALTRTCSTQHDA